MRSRIRHRRDARRGATLIVVLICLLAIALLAATLLRLAVAQGRQLRLHERQLQAEWLATAALDRAAAEIAVDPQWIAEVWSLPLDVLGEPASVTLERATSPAGESANVWVAQAIVGAPEGPPVRVTLRRELPARDAATTAGATP